MSNARLKGKTIVIIGGTTGIGLSASKACLAAGARLVAIGRNPDNVAAAQATLGGNAHVMSGDASKPSTATLAIQKAVTLFGDFHALYHVAGGSGRKMGDGPLHEITDDGWTYTINLNLTSMFYSNRAAIRQFLKQKTGGSVLNLGSVLGYSPSPHFFATHSYAAAKAGIVGLTQSAASYYAPKNIRVNVLAPALVDTPMAQRAVREPSILEYINTKQPLDGGRVGRPEDLDAAAVYFLSDESRFVTGQLLSVDGGWSLSEGEISTGAIEDPQKTDPK